MSGFKTIRNVIVIAGTLAATGYWRLPVEQKFTEDLRERKVMQPQIEVGTWGEMGQTSLAGAVGGLRTVMASMLTLAAHSHFEENEWYDLEKDYEVITALEPYNEFYWDHGGWHLGYNAASWARHYEEYSPTRRRIEERHFLEKGDAFYRRGLKFIPESNRLWFEIGAMWSNEYKRPDLERAAEAFAMVRNSPNPVFRRRFLITIAKIPGREIEAYDEVMRLLGAGGRFHLMTPTFRCLLLVLSSNPDLRAGDLRAEVGQVYDDKDKAYQDLYNYRIRALKEGFYRGKLDEMLRELIVEIEVPDELNPFLNPRVRPIGAAKWREAYERRKAAEAAKEGPDWFLKKPEESEIEDETGS